MNRPASAASRLMILVSLASASAGCGEAGPSLIKVSGTVTHDGKPLEGAVVSFLPDPSNPNGRHAEDLTGPEGNYRAMTDGRTGLVPGKYHIVVSKAPPASAAASENFQDDPFMAQMSTAPAGKAKGKGASDAIEATFDRDISPDATVQDFDVKTKATAAR